MEPPWPPPCRPARAAGRDERWHVPGMLSWSLPTANLQLHFMNHRRGQATPSPPWGTQSTFLEGSTRRACPSAQMCMHTTCRSGSGASCRCVADCLRWAVELLQSSLSISVQSVNCCLITRLMLCVLTECKVLFLPMPGGRHAAAAPQRACRRRNRHRLVRVWRALRHRHWGGRAE